MACLTTDEAVNAALDWPEDESWLRAESLITGDTLSTVPPPISLMTLRDTTIGEAIFGIEPDEVPRLARISHQYVDTWAKGIDETSEMKTA